MHELAETFMQWLYGCKSKMAHTQALKEAWQSKKTKWKGSMMSISENQRERCQRQHWSERCGITKATGVGTDITNTTKRAWSNPLQTTTDFMLHLWAWMPNCVCSVCTLTPVPHPHNPLVILPSWAQLRPSHSTGQTAGPLISSFGADQWHWWQEPKRGPRPKRGLNKTPLSNDGLGANNPGVRGSGGGWPGWVRWWRCPTGPERGVLSP